MCERLSFVQHVHFRALVTQKPVSTTCGFGHARTRAGGRTLLRLVRPLPALVRVLANLPNIVHNVLLQWVSLEYFLLLDN